MSRKKVPFSYGDPSGPRNVATQSYMLSSDLGPALQLAGGSKEISANSCPMRLPLPVKLPELAHPHFFLLFLDLAFFSPSLSFSRFRFFFFFFFFLSFLSLADAVVSLVVVADDEEEEVVVAVVVSAAVVSSAAGSAFRVAMFCLRSLAATAGEKRNIYSLTMRGAVGDGCCGRCGGGVNLIWQLLSW